MIRTILKSLTARMPRRVIYDREGGSPYLSRWYVFGRQRGNENVLPVNLFIHKFHRGDDDAALHSHPWKWSVSLILAGGYREERRNGTEVEQRTLRPGSINVILGDDFHRVDLLEHDAWSLFLAGPHDRNWYFWDRTKNAILPWATFIFHRRHGHLDLAPWEPENPHHG